MHTAICTFEDRAQAEQAAERLVQSGFDRREVHVEHRHADGTIHAGCHTIGFDELAGIARQIGLAE